MPTLVNSLRTQAPRVSVWANAWANQAAGVGQARIATFGDSITQGFYAAQPFHTNAWANRLGALLDAFTGVPTGTGYVPVYERNMAGGGGNATGETRFSSTGVWTGSTTSGPFRHAQSASASATMTFGPVTCDSFRIYFATDPAGGSCSASVDGGAPTVFSTLGAAGVSHVDIPSTAGTHTLVVTAPSSGTLVLFGVEGIRNTTTGVNVSRIGYTSTHVSQFVLNTTSADSLPSARAAAPHLAIIGFGVNEADDGISTSLYQSRLTTAINAFKADGADVALFIEPPPNPSAIPTTWADYVTVQRNLAASLDCALIDITARWVDYATSTAFYNDDFHPNNAGAADIATAAFAAVKTLAGV